MHGLAVAGQDAAHRTRVASGHVEETGILTKDGPEHHLAKALGQALTGNGIEGLKHPSN